MSSGYKRQGHTHFSTQEKWTKGKGNREKTNKERETLSLILIEYHKCTRNKRGRVTYRTKISHADKGYGSSYARRHARARARNELRAHARTQRAYA